VTPVRPSIVDNNLLFYFFGCLFGPEGPIGLNTNEWKCDKMSAVDERKTNLDNVLISVYCNWPPSMELFSRRRYDTTTALPFQHKARSFLLVE